MRIVKFVFARGTTTQRQEELMARVRGWADVVSVSRLVPGVDENAPTFRIVCVRVDVPGADVSLVDDLRKLPDLEYVTN